MYKIIVLGVVLSLQLGDVLGWGPHPYPMRPQPVIIDRMPMPPMPRGFSIAPPIVHGSLWNAVKGVNDFNAPVQQTSTDISSNNIPTDLMSAPTRQSQTELSNSVNIVGKQLSSEYLVTKGIGAHKLHLRKLSWNKARQVCIDEGGQLTDIRSDAEEKIILRMLFEDSVKAAWIGYHDMFEEGEWVSVLGEPLGKSGWDRWWTKHLPNPDNGNGDIEEDCASLRSDGGGINDYICNKELSFVCKIPAL